MSFNPIETHKDDLKVKHNAGTMQAYSWSTVLLCTMFLWLENGDYSAQNVMYTPFLTRVEADVEILSGWNQYGIEIQIKAPKGRQLSNHRIGWGLTPASNTSCSLVCFSTPQLCSWRHLQWVDTLVSTSKCNSIQRYCHKGYFYEAFTVSLVALGIWTLQRPYTLIHKSEDGCKREKIKEMQESVSKQIKPAWTAHTVCIIGNLRQRFAERNRMFVRVTDGGTSYR